ncbi:MAG: serpin family protein [Anaerolineae bacterium]
MKHLLKRSLLLVALLGIVGCTMSPPVNDGQAQSGQIVLAASDESRVTNPEVPSEDLAALIEGNQAFALDLYHYLAQISDGDLFLSPHSITAALAMTYAGARGETEAEMAETLHFNLPQDRLHPAFNALDQALSQRGEGAEGKDGEGFRLHIVNALWGQKDYEFQQAFLDVLARNYGAGLRLVNFIEDAEAARQTINEWVSDQTEGRIEDLIPQGALDALTRLVLTNAIYFNAAWAEPFEERQTEQAPFYLLDGTTVEVPMMHQTTPFDYAAGEGYQAVALPYDGHELSMVILLPDTGEFTEFEQSLDSETLTAILEDFERQRLILSMPRFEMRSKFSLTDALTALGMPTAFTEEADFSGMTGNRELMITDVFHQAFVSVDEEGTEAAAATAVVVGLTSAMPGEPVEMTIDRPFIFLIRDNQTGAVLFVGRIFNPAAE